MKKITKFALCLASAFGVCSAQAGGYQLNDYSVTGLGRSYAGAGIMGDDYSAIAYNPAGMTLMKQSGVQASGFLLNLRADVDELGGNGHKKMNFWQPIPATFAQVNATDRLSFGLGVYAPFGLKTHYDRGWFAEDNALLSKLDVIDINFSAAYKVTPKWSIGASAILRYIYGNMSAGLSDELGGGEHAFEVEGWTQTGALGVMYEPTKNTRFGLSWRMRSTQNTKGHHEIKNNQNNGISQMTSMGAYTNFNEYATSWASPDLPETLTFSAYHRYKDVGFSGTARFTHWSQSFPEFTLESDSRLFGALEYLQANGLKETGVENGGSTSKYKYRNSWTLTAGVDYYYCKNLTFRFGGGWDESPTHSNSNRSIRIPDNDRFWLSVGASYMKNNWQIDVGYAHMIARTGKALETSSPTSKDVKFKNMQSHILGLQVQYKF